MPGPVVHVGHALFYGFILTAASKEKFSGLHCALLALNAFIGPDIGSFIEWLFRLVLPPLADFCMTVIHSPWGYNISVGPLLALALSALSKYIVLFRSSLLLPLPAPSLKDQQPALLDALDALDALDTLNTFDAAEQSHVDYASPAAPPSTSVRIEMEGHNQPPSRRAATSFPLRKHYPPGRRSALAAKLYSWTQMRPVMTDGGSASNPRLPTVVLAHGMPEPLSFSQCYLLGIAGSLLHFQLDYIFEENGTSPLFRRIISTGYWESPQPPLSAPSVLLVGLCTLALFCGFAWIFLFAGLSSHLAKTRRAVLLFGAVFSVYIVYLYACQVLLQKTAVVGEEADLGTLPFLICFYFLPLLLCLQAV